MQFLQVLSKLVIKDAFTELAICPRQRCNNERRTFNVLIINAFCLLILPRSQKPGRHNMKLK